MRARPAAPSSALVPDHRLNDHHHRRLRHAANPAKQPDMRVHDARQLPPDRSNWAATRAGTRRLKLLSVTNCPSASVLGWQVSHLSTDRMGKVNGRPDCGVATQGPRK